MDVVERHGALPPDDLSGPISVQWKRDPMILQATATHWRYGRVKCSGYASQCVDRHYHVGKSQRYVVANTVQQQARWFRHSTFEQWDYKALWRDLSSHHARPNHNATTPITVTFDDIILVQPLPSSPSSSNPVISKWHVKSRFVRKQNVVPLPASSVLMNPGPLASSFTVSQRQRNTIVGTARFQSSSA